MDEMRAKQVVMLGEASHGTHEYYTWRTRISQELIEDGFRFIAVEGDWPDCYELNRFVKGWPGAGASAQEVVRKFDRWPTWMWANWEVVALAEWMRNYNEGRPEHEKAGFYGLDVYSLWDSLAVVFEHLKQHHPQQLAGAMAAMSCFEPFNRDVQEYAWHTRLFGDNCADEVLRLLQALKSDPLKYPDDPESHFNAEQNALIAVGAERYYRAMALANDESWNVRDRHMMDTLDRLLAFHGTGARAIVWEHNTHVGDARATDMHAAGMVNLGQLGRERYGAENVFLLGFGSYAGTVLAGDRWGAPMREMVVPPAREGSWEALLKTLSGDRLVYCKDLGTDFQEPIGHRAIGVVYNPDHERFGNYVPSVIPERYDAFLFLEQTRALHAIHMSAHAGPEPPETYPWGF